MSSLMQLIDSSMRWFVGPDLGNLDEHAEELGWIARPFGNRVVLVEVITGIETEPLTFEQAERMLEFIESRRSFRREQPAG